MRPTFTRSLALVAVAVLALSGCASKKDPTADGSTTATGLGKFGPTSDAGTATGTGFGVDGGSVGSAADGFGAAGGSDLLGSGSGTTSIGNAALGGLGQGNSGGFANGGTFADGGTGTYTDGGTYGSTGLIDGGVISAAPSGGVIYTDPNATQAGTYNNALFDNNAGGGNGGFTTYGSDAGGTNLSGYNFPGDNGSPSYFSQQVGNRVLFETDSVILNENSRETLRRQAAWLQLHPEHSAILEGHADERGTREYNLALGSGRADSVRAYLSSLGVSASRLRTVSYGKERPISLGSGPSAWAQNRRVETVLSNGANF